MTPAEFRATVTGYYAADERALERVAWQTALLLNMVSDKVITPDQLLGRVLASGHLKADE